ncbi:MurR/RpiR family transcriptional regulator [Lactobacillus isalae]|uniref:MurR/RpiR family transcriptional regulator n=1 Tax=Lactobacillus isalae TaxID=2993455 RepID=UPI0024A9A1AF|nr:MurR/RpiR family transcriptional regulator [Lactobacillus isalae]
MKLEDKISLYYTSLTKSEKKVYQAVTKNPQTIINNSIQKAAKDLGVSVASIQRFINKLEYSGYPEFKLALQKQEESKKQHPSTLSTHNPIIHAYIRSFHLLENLDLDNFLKPLIKDLREFQNIKSIGNGNTALSAKQLVYSMYSEDKFLDAVDTSIKIDYLANSVDKNTLLIIFSVTAPQSTYGKLIKKARERGVRTYLITMNQESKLLSQVSNSIVLPSTHVEHDDNTLHRVDSRAVLYVFAEMISYYYAIGLK